MILKTFWMSVWWLVHAIRNPSAHLPHILLRHHLQLLVLTSSTMKLVHFTNGKLFIFLVDIFFKKGTSIRGYFVFYGRSKFDLITIFQEAYLVFFFFSNEIQNAVLHSYLFFLNAFFKIIFPFFILWLYIFNVAWTRSKWRSWYEKKTHQWSNKQYPIK